MIFHAAYPLKAEPRNASALRPVRMRSAFEEIGYEVIEISGFHAQRREQIKALKHRIESGLEVAFVYSEAATTPTGLGEPVTPATSLTRDISFLRFCQRRGIPVGLFYRDIYWCFPIYTETVKWPIATILRRFYRWDLRRYRRAGFRIYLPSEQMADWMPIIDRARVGPLPPGGDPHPSATTDSAGRLRLLYVGGLGSNYRLHESVKEMSGLEGVEITLCMPEAHWVDRRNEYERLISDNIRIVHESGAALERLYANTDACMLVVEPIKYWGFAAPVKLFEYLSYGKPILASNDTFSGDFVRDNGLGWSVEYGSGQLRELLEALRSSPESLATVAKHVREVREDHTWQARAREVARDLAGRGA